MKIAQVDLIKTVDNKTYISNGLQVGDKLISKNQILIFNQLTSQ
jgi:cobalt-zinc-cadmium efflux system membrane fusion protein